MAVVPAHLRATTTGIAEVCWTGANAVGPMVAGLLSDTLGDPNKSAEEGDHSGLVTMLLIGATIPLGHAAIAWHWRGSVADEIATQQQVRSATSLMPHDVHEEVRLPVVARMFVLFMRYRNHWLSPMPDCCVLEERCCVPGGDAHLRG